MNHVASIAVLVAAGLAVAGCADNSLTSLLDGRSTPSQSQAQTYQDLSMPPDLQLRAPGTVSSTAAPAEVTAPATRTAATQPNLYAPSAAEPQGDIYERNGISKVHPDGSPKTGEELKAELKQVYLAKKQQQNPNYGTIFNIGNIFNDG
jgi:hypothetical protein